MQKFLLLSVLLSTVAIPIIASRERSAHRGLKKTLFFMFVFNLGYLLFLRWLYFRL